MREKPWGRGWALFIYNVVLTFETANEFMWCNNSNETSSAGLLHGTIQHLTSRILNFVYFFCVHCVKELIIIIIIIIVIMIMLMIVIKLDINDIIIIMIRIFTSSVVDTSVVGWLQSVHNTFLRCLRDVK